MTVQTVAFFIVTPRSLVDRYQRFEGTYCIHFQGRSDPEDVELSHKMEVTY
jgi:hypothetical protein